MKVSWRSASMGVCVLALSGCGAIFNGTRQTISTTATPDQTNVTVDMTQAKYTTPAFISLERKNDYNLTFSKEGYTPGVFHISHSMNGGILVLDILTGLIGVVVDAATGAWYSLNPSTVQITLTKTTAAVAGPDTIRVGIYTKGNRIKVGSNVPGVIVDVKRQ